MPFNFKQVQFTEQENRNAPKLHNKPKLNLLRHCDTSCYLYQPKVEDLVVAPQTVDDLKLLDLSSRHIRHIRLLSTCKSLVICDLSCNFISNISSLKACTNLKFLDLHSNQITQLPKFWSSLSQLSVLYLHNNGLSSLAELTNLAEAESLIHLTLYDTPLSLKKSYRHSVVNGVMSLRALDCCVISDEEIIEKAEFPLKFKPMQSQFRFRPVPMFYKNRFDITFKRALRHVHRNHVVINSIQSKYSPVLIIQKWVRRFLVRLHKTYLQDTRLWASVLIQRFWRSKKGISNPLPSSPINTYHKFICRSRSSMILDYDTYMKSRRSFQRSRTKTDRTSCIASESKPVVESNVSSMLECFSESIKCAEDSDDSELLTEEALRKLAKALGFLSIPVERLPRRKYCTRVGKYYTQREFLGAMTPMRSMESCDLQPVVNRPHEQLRNPYEEYLLRTVKGAEDVRNSLREMHAQLEEPHACYEFKRDEKRVKQAMELSCFRAVDQAYVVRDTTEQIIRRKQRTKYARERARCVQLRTEKQKQKARDEASLKKHSERLRVIELLALHKSSNMETLRRFADIHAIHQHVATNSKKDLKFAQVFNCQNVSVGKSIGKQERVLKNRAKMSTLVDMVKGLREENCTGKQLVRDYLERSKLLMQTENSNFKAEMSRALRSKELERYFADCQRLYEIKVKNEKKISPGNLLRSRMIAFPEAED